MRDPDDVVDTEESWAAASARHRRLGLDPFATLPRDEDRPVNDHEFALHNAEPDPETEQECAAQAAE